MTKNVNGNLLRRGYTTGSCAAAAAKAAVIRALTGELPKAVTIAAPKGVTLTIPINTDGSVTKDGGDDPDVTNGVRVYADIERAASGITIDGGEGVGRVTQAGLDQPVGAAAINSVPRKMIESAVAEAAAAHGYGGGFRVVISVPGGAALAAKTFNPRMGIEGGISIIGTTGIVEPMSHAAIADTVRLELRQLRERGAEGVLLTPGNYGETFARDTLGLDMTLRVACSNCVGEAVDCAAELGFRRVLLVGHIGKLVKLGIGVTNTHSDFGDGRVETLAACALAAGAGVDVLRGIMGSVTTDAALAIIDGAGLLSGAMGELARRIMETLARRAPPEVEVGFVCFTNTGLGVLARGGLGVDTFRGGGAGRG